MREKDSPAVCCVPAPTYLWQPGYGGRLEQSLAYTAGDPELLFLCHVGAVLEAAAAVASAHGVCIDDGDGFWAVEDAEGGHDDEVPHAFGEVRLAAEGVQQLRRDHFGLRGIHLGRDGHGWAGTTGDG